MAGVDVAAAAVSVIIVTYNSGNYIARCLESLRRQSYPAPEIILYDNASGDGTAALVAAGFGDVKLIAGDVNLGFAAACNRAAQAAWGDVLAFLNPDTIVAYDWLAALVHALTADPHTGAATSQVLLAEAPETINACGNAVHLSGVAYCHRIGEPAMAGEPVAVNAFSGAAFAIRRADFERAGGFESTFFLYYEDADLSLRLRGMGLSIVVAPASQVWHDYRTEPSPEKVFYLERNRYLSLCSLLPLRALILMAPSLALAEAFAWGDACLRGTDALAAKARSWLAIARAVPWLRERRRRYVQKQGLAVYMCGAFTARLHLRYVRAGSSPLVHLAEAAAWLVAAPALAVARWVAGRS